MRTHSLAAAGRMLGLKAVPAKWQVCLALAALAAAATYLPQSMEAWRLDRAALYSGQGWRLLTGHLVHMNTPHLMLNLLALCLLCELVWGALDWRHGVGLLFFGALGTAGVLLAWHPEVAWYAGLSGILHGLWAGCALYGLCPLPAAPADAQASTPAMHSWQARWPVQRRVCAVALVLLCLKLGFEFYFGPSQRTEQAIGGTVIAVSHAYGALTGVIYLLLWRGLANWRRAVSLRFRLK